MKQAPVYGLAMDLAFEREKFFAGDKVLAKYGATFSIGIVLEVMGAGKDCALEL